MCGIAGIHVKDNHIGRFPVDRLMDELLLGIETRGRDATGFVALNAEGKILMQKAPVKASLFTKKRRNLTGDVKTVLLHTRLATQGGPEFSENNHPVMYETCFVTHNGHIHNDDEVFKKLDIPRTAAVDTIAIAAALNYHGIASIDDIKEALKSLRGSYAFAAIDPGLKKGRLLLVKGPTSPLWVMNHSKAVIWASTKDAILSAWGKVLGTPPTKEARFWKGEFDGITDMGHARMFVFDGDDFVYEQFSTFSSFTGQHTHTSTAREADFLDAIYGCEWDADEWERWDKSSERRTIHLPSSEKNREADEHYMRSKGYEKDPTDGWVLRSNRTSGSETTSDAGGLGPKKFTCTPNFKACIHPCTEGCDTMECECYTGNPNHPKEAGRIARFFGGKKIGEIARGEGSTDRAVIDPTTGGVIEGTVLDANDDEYTEEAECDGCSGWYDIRDTNELTLGDTRWTLCETCWVQESDAPFRRESDPVDRLALRDSDEEGERSKADAIHERAISELAFELDCSPKFVSWLVFDCSDDELRARPALKGLFEAVANEYQNAHAIASDLYNGIYEGG